MTFGHLCHISTIVLNGRNKVTDHNSCWLCSSRLWTQTFENLNWRMPYWALNRWLMVSLYWEYHMEFNRGGADFLGQKQKNIYISKQISIVSDVCAQKVLVSTLNLDTHTFLTLYTFYGTHAPGPKLISSLCLSG